MVTGGSRGIGRAICHQFAEHGAHVLLTYRSNKKSAESTLADLPGTGHAIYRMDVGQIEDIKGLFNFISESDGGIDIVVNNAGIGYHHPVDQCDFDQWDKGWQEILGINLLGPAHVCYHAAQFMIRQHSGTIINITSRGAFRGEPDQPAYGASKAALNSLTQSLAYSLSRYNIFVGAVAPGFVETDMAAERLKGAPGDAIKAQSPMNRVAKPEEVAQAVILMAQSNQWMTGGIFDVNGASYFRT